MADSGISGEEFARLQSQLIELRTQNYEISEKFRRTNDENSFLQKQVEAKEKELQKTSKLMKIPGFTALTKNKNKKSYDEIHEENERLANQMQRHEEDFKLQNKTLLEEISRLSEENKALGQELENLKDSRSRQQDENDEIRRIKAENTVLNKKIQELELSRNNKNEAISNDSTDCGDECTSPKNEDEGEDFVRLKELIDNTLIKLGKKDDNFEEDQNEEDKEESIKEFVSNIRTLIKPTNSSINSTELEELKVSFETEKTENRLLRDQLKDERERTQKEMTALKTEIDKLTEKTKRKQESFLQLQDEKENLHKQNRQLEDKLINIKKDHAQTEEQVLELSEVIEILRKQEENSTRELIKLKEKIQSCSPEKIAELDNVLNEKNEELTALKLQIEEISSSNQDLMSEIQKISEENTHLEEVSKKNEEIALKRKNLLDKLSVERQHELTSHQEELSVYKNDIEEYKKKLESCMSDLEKSKREVTVSNDRHSELLQNYNSIEKRAGWLERTLKELEAQIETERQDHLLALQQKEAETQEQIENINSEHLTELQKVNDEKVIIEREKEEQMCVIEKLNQAAKDKEIEFRINNKKGDQLLKDLKRQLKMERKRADQVQQRLQDFLTESKCKQTFDELFNKPELSMYKGHRRQDSGSHLSTVSSNSGLELTADNENTKSSTPLSGTPLSGGSDSFRLNDETIELISKVADLQLEKNVLEEKVRHLEENSSVMVDDLMQKTRIIQSYIKDRKVDIPNENIRKKSMTLKEKMKDSLHIGKHGKTEDMLKEMNAKMQRLLEETLEKNIQLEKDVDHLTRELEKYSKPN